MVKDGSLDSTSRFRSRKCYVVRLTEMPMQASIPSEVQEISVKKQEGKAIIVKGRYAGAGFIQLK